MPDTNRAPGVEAYKATLGFISKLASLAFLGFLAWLVVPRLGGLFRWVGGLDPKVLMMVVVAPFAALVLVACFAIYAVFFRGTKFVEHIVGSETAKEAVRRGKASVTVDVEAEPPPGG